MYYRVLAAGPIIAGNATISHRLVLLAWTYDHPCLAKPIEKLSVHTQQFFGPDFPKRKRSVALSQGDYFIGESREIEAPLRFAARLAKHLERYGQCIDVNLAFDDYEHARLGEA